MPSPRLIRFLYNQLAFAYEATLALGARIGISHELHIRRHLIANLEFPPGAHLLDLGCGTAAVRRYLPKHIHYVGLDFALYMLRRARPDSVAQGRLLCADLQSPPLRPHQFDVLFCMGVLQHLPQPRHTLTQLPRLLRSGAQILILDEQQPDRKSTRLNSSHSSVSRMPSSA